MPLLGKRKYINEKIEGMIDKLDKMGYDTREIKKRFYDLEDEQPATEFPEFEEDSAGAILPYRSKINDVLKMIDELINGKIEEFDINDVPMVSPYEFKNNVMNTLQDTQRNEVFTQQPQNQTFNLF
jgi:hypothetical protein